MSRPFDPLLRTNPAVAIRAGQIASRRLLIRSGAVHLLAVATCAFLSLACAAGVIPAPSAGFMGLVALVFLVVLVVGTRFAATRGLPGACLGLAAISLGILTGGGEGALTGAGIPFGVALFSAELGAFTLRLADRNTWIAGTSLMFPAVTTSALIYGLDGSDVHVGVTGYVAGAVAATFFVWHARLAENIVPWRHGIHDVAAAAFSRWGEGARVLWLRILEVPHDVLESTPREEDLVE